jgi:hypothetical protein
MNKTLSSCLLTFAALAPLSAMAAEPLVRFEGGIGETPVSSLVTVTVSTPTGTTTINGPSANVVQGVPPGGQPWVISSLSADVSTDGGIKVDGRGLLLAGGNGIGTNGGQSVRARLICAGVPSDSDVVPLEADGDFRIKGTLIPTPPSICNTPVLLILNGNLTPAGTRWFAAGIVKQ